MSGRGYRAALCALLAIAIYLPCIARPPLLEPDEGRYAEIAREMVVSGDYLTPRDDWVRYFEKPPLVYWVTAAAIRVFGKNEFAARLQAVLFTAGEVAATEVVAEQMYGVSVGLLAALSLALSPIVIGFAVFATLDPALSFFVVAALAVLYPVFAEDEGSRARVQRRMYAAAVLLALGTLTKGPVAVVLAGGAVLGFLILERRSRRLLEIPWLGPLILYLAVTAPWFVAVAWRNPGFLRFFVVHEHIQRYLHDREHGWGPYFFVPVVVAGTWPWLYFAGLSLKAFWRSSDVAGGASARRAIRFLAVWFLWVFVFFSIPRSKLGSYILPAIPAVAVLAGLGLERLGHMDRRAMRRAMLLFALLNAGLFLSAVIGLAVASDRLGQLLVTDGLIAASGVLLVAIMSWIAARGYRSARFVAAAMASGMILVAGGAAKARLDGQALYSYRCLARAVVPYLKPGCILGSYRHFVQALPFYTDHRETLIGYRGELAPFSRSPDAQASFIKNDRELARSWSSQSCVVIVADFANLQHLDRILHPKPSLIACEGKKLALYNGRLKGAMRRYDCRAGHDGVSLGAALGSAANRGLPTGANAGPPRGEPRQ